MSLMATGNINCPILGRSPDPFNFGPLQNRERQAVTMQPRSSNDEPFSMQPLTIDVFDNQNDPNDNRVPREPSWGLNENILQWNNDNYSRNMRGCVIPEEQLTINVDTDEGGMHEWCPSLSNSLSSDFFLPQSGLATGGRHADQSIPVPELIFWGSEFQSDPAAASPESGQQQAERNLCTGDGAGYPRMDVQKHIQSQRTQLNCLKYEIINAKRRLHESQADVAKLTCEIEEKLLFQNSKDVQNLRDENAELRLECQCLCMEVDLYLKGNAPLGEIDEQFYKGNASSAAEQNINEVQPQLSCEQQQFSTEEQEEANKWECPKCTFVNHPAINSCEMCNITRVGSKSFPLHNPSSETCYCHPQEKNFS